MGGFLDKPETDKEVQYENGIRLHYGLASMQGWRIKMEDRYDTKINLAKNLEDWSYFAVFDGHAGDRAATYCSENLLNKILTSKDMFKDNIYQSIRDGFIHLDEDMRLLSEMASGEDKSGTTCVCAFVSPETIYIANCGDSRAVFCRSGEPFLTTVDHRPRMSKEHCRIVKAGAYIKNGRINGRLAVSRALGDFPYKNVENLSLLEQPVSPDPEIFGIERDDTVDEFMILASDGIWNVVSEIEICRYIRSRMMLTHQLEEIASQVLDMCLYKNGDDNMTIIIVAFPGAPAISQEAIQAEQDLDANLERLLKEVIAQSPDKDYSEVIWNLRNLTISDLPPGGIDAKGAYITELYKQLCPELAHTAAISRY